MNIPKEISPSNIGVAPFRVQLVRPKDNADQEALDRANRVGADMDNLLRQSFAANKEAQAKIQITVNIASEGSRKARFWAVQFGHGHAKLGVSWSLVYNGQVVSTHTLWDTSSVGCGIDDMFQSDAGDRALDIMADSFACRIVSAVQQGLKKA